MEVDEERTLLSAVRTNQSLEVRYSTLGMCHHRHRGHGTVHRWKCPPHRLPPCPVHAWASNIVLPWRRPFCDHNVELVWAQGSFPHQLYSKRRRGVSWSLLFHRRCCRSQCQRRPALPRGAGCAIRGECAIQTDNLDAVFILVHSLDCSCNTSYCHCLHTQCSSHSRIWYL